MNCSIGMREAVPLFFLYLFLFSIEVLQSFSSEGTIPVNIHAYKGRGRVVTVPKHYTGSMKVKLNIFGTLTLDGAQSGTVCFISEDSEEKVNNSHNRRPSFGLWIANFGD